MPASKKRVLTKAQIGLRIQQLRRRCAYTQMEFAGAAGYSEDYLQRLESGARQPSMKCLKALCDAASAALPYPVSMEELFPEMFPRLPFESKVKE